MARYPKPPAGWIVVSGTLQMDRSIAGHLVRDHDVRGRCYMRDCKRSCHIDHRGLVERGLGVLTVDQVKKTMVCSRLDGCGLYFTGDPSRESLPLAALTGRLAVKVRVLCRSCGKGSAVTPETMVQRLKKMGKGDEMTRTSEIASHFTKACDCGKTHWQVDVQWPDPNTMGGRRALEQAEAELERGRLSEPTDF